MKQLVAIAAFAIATCSFAQPRPATSTGVSPDPATAIERLQLAHGRMLVRGTQRIGDISGTLSTTVSVFAVELRDATTKQRGVSIETVQRDRTERKGSSFIDRDELDSLILAAENMLKLGDGITTLQTYEVSFKTRGGFELAMFTQFRNGPPTFSFSAGQVNKAYAFSDDKAAPEKLVLLLKEARTLLDTLK